MTTRLLAVAASATLVFTGAGALAHATDTPHGPLGSNDSLSKDASELNWGNKDIPTGSQIRREMKEGKRPNCTVKVVGNEARSTCTNKTTTPYFAVVTATCSANNANGTTTPANGSFAIPAHGQASGVARCAKNTTVRGAMLTGPITRHEAELIQQNQLEFMIKSMM